MRVIKFGRHRPPNIGHIVIEARHGLFSRGRRKRVKVQLVNGRWLSEDGKDYTAEIENIENLKQIKKLEALCTQ